MQPISDLHYGSKVTHLKDSATLTNGTVSSSILDTHGYHALEFILTSFVVTDGTHTVSLVQGDDPALADGAAVPADEVLGSAVWTAGQDGVARSVGFIGKKRYVRLDITTTGASTGGTFGPVTSFQGHARHGE